MKAEKQFRQEVERHIMLPTFYRDGKYTCCVIRLVTVRGKSLVAWAFAACNPKDEADQLRGDSIAYGRALKRLAAKAMLDGDVIAAVRPPENLLLGLPA